MKAFEDVAKLARDRGLAFVELWMVDLPGRAWRVATKAQALAPGYFSDGLQLDGGTIGPSWPSSILARPELEAVYPDPLGGALIVFCGVDDPAAGRPLPREPRHVLKAAEALVRDRLKASVKVGIEPEFFISERPGEPASEGVVFGFLRELAAALDAAGMESDWFRTGPGPGQGRVQMRAASPLVAADRVMIYRRAAASLARARGLSLSFLPKPALGAACGMPMHLALWRGGENLFHGEGWAATSALCRRWAGGLLKRLPALAAFCAPSTNSYRRLIPGVSGPAVAVLSAARGEAACRVPGRNPAPGARRVKLCLPDPTANPYLALAAALMAGLDGVENGPEAVAEAPAPRGRAFPDCLEAALGALESDGDFLKEGGVFSEALLDGWIKDRWERHIIPVRTAPHPRELVDADPYSGGVSTIEFV